MDTQVLLAPYLLGAIFYPLACSVSRKVFWKPCPPLVSFEVSRGVLFFLLFPSLLGHSSRFFLFDMALVPTLVGANPSSSPSLVPQVQRLEYILASPEFEVMTG